MIMQWSWGLWLFLACPVIAQTADTLYTDIEFIATIPAARQLAVDGQGFIYVATGREVIQIDVGGQVHAQLGGMGIDQGAFGEVVDIDPGTGPDLGGG